MPKSEQRRLSKSHLVGLKTVPTSTTDMNVTETLTEAPLSDAQLLLSNDSVYDETIYTATCCTKCSAPEEQHVEVSGDYVLSSEILWVLKCGSSVKLHCSCKSSKTTGNVS